MDRNKADFLPDLEKKNSIILSPGASDDKAEDYGKGVIFYLVSSSKTFFALS